MPVEFPTFSGSPNEDPRAALRLFLDVSRQFLHELISTGRSPRDERLFHDELIPPMREAWIEIQPLFEDVINAVGLRDRPARLALTNSSIVDHGIWGAQLRFKLAVVRFLYNRYLNVGRGALRRLLEAIDTLLSSILSAIGGGESVKEIKEYIEHSLDDGT